MTTKKNPFHDGSTCIHDSPSFRVFASMAYGQGRYCAGYVIYSEGRGLVIIPDRDRFLLREAPGHPPILQSTLDAALPIIKQHQFA